MKFNIRTWMLVIVAAFMITACSEPGVGGKKEITGKVTYNGSVAEGAVVYITYDATEAGGEYDAATLTDASGMYHFDGLQKGDYYVDAEYTNQYGIEFHTAGFSVTINEKKGTVDLDIPLK